MPIYAVPARDDMIREYHAVNGRLSSRGMRRRAEKGLPNYRPPLGYVLVRDARGERVVFDDTVAPLVKKAFVLAAGKSLRKALAVLADEGLRSKGGKQLSPVALSNLLKNRFYLGQVRHRGQWLPGSHEPLVDWKMFDQAQRKSANRASEVGR